MFDNRRPIDISGLERPLLLVVIDTEEDFDWDAEPRRDATRVDSMTFIHRVQEIFDEYGIRPCYVADYPIADHWSSASVLKEIHDTGRCEIGAHLHPWVCPPYSEPLTRANMYPGNLEAALELEKLARLASRIEEVFGQRPTSYKAGRYGFGPATASALERLGFNVDLSICPAYNHGSDGGPDYSREAARPFWFGEGGRLLEIPLTAGFVGWAGRARRSVYNFGSRLEKLKAPGVLSRLGVVDRLVLSPEGFTPAEHSKLTRFLLKEGVRTFTWSFHSPSVVPGNTPYVHTDRDLSRFLDSFRRYFDFFFGDLGGATATPRELRTRLEQPGC